MDLKQILKEKLKKLNEEKGLTPKESESKEDEIYKNLLMEWGKKPPTPCPSTSAVPKFFKKIPSETEPLRYKLREQARSHLLQQKSMKLLNKPEMTQLWELLDQNQSNPEEQMLTYADFNKIANLVGPRTKHYLKPSIFAKLQQGDSKGRVSSMALVNYVMNKIWLDQTRVGLSVHDTMGQGYLTETELQNYITDILPELSKLDGLEKSFHNFYVCTAVRKFMFFLDPGRSNRVRILDILACGFMSDLLELRDDDGSTKESQEQNWFSAPSALRIYGHYLNLDRDHNGMLSKSELAGYGTGTLTQPFIDRVFQTCLTYGGEIDFKTYLDLVLALENRAEPQALAFLFKMLDIKGEGHLDAFTLNYFFRFPTDTNKRELWREIVGLNKEKILSKWAYLCSDHFDSQDVRFAPTGRRYLVPNALPKSENFEFLSSRAIQDQMKAHGYEQPVTFQDVKDELFDMVRPKDPERITLQDLISCGQGETFVSILIEFQGFWAYEHREAISIEPQDI